MKKIKKAITLAIIMFASFNHLNANIDITNDSVIKYKWYQEAIVNEVYYPKGSILENYQEDQSKITYGEYTDWQNGYCSYSSDNYQIEKKQIFTYDEIVGTQYLRLAPNTYRGQTCYDCLHKFNVYYNDNLVPYEKEILEYNTIILTLPEIYDSSKLSFEVETDYIIDLTLSQDKDFTKPSLAYFILKNDYLDSTRAIVNDYTTYELKTSDTFQISPFVKLETISEICRVRAINTYRYQIKKEYYDDNYYEYVDNYLPEIDDYIVEYKKEFPKEINEVIKEVPVVEKEYVKEYIYSENPNQDIDDNDINNTFQDKIVKSPDDKIENTPILDIDNILDTSNKPENIKENKLTTSLKTIISVTNLNKISFITYLILIILTLTFIITLIRSHKKYVD